MESLGPLGFGVLLRRYRLEAEITQQELAERANISVEAVSTLERGARRRPQRQTIDLLATALGLSSGQQGALLEAADATVPKPRLRIVGSAKSGAIESVPNNLPWQVTPLIGRDDVLTEVEPLVLEHALVSFSWNRRRRQDARGPSGGRCICSKVRARACGLSTWHR